MLQVNCAAKSLFILSTGAVIGPNHARIAQRTLTVSDGKRCELPSGDKYFDQSFINRQNLGLIVPSNPGLKLPLAAIHRER